MPSWENRNRHRSQILLRTSDQRSSDTSEACQEFVRLDRIVHPRSFTADGEWERVGSERIIASEQLWVNGMAGMFDLLTTNYKAQERLVAEQLRLARRTTRATIAMTIIAGAAIVATVLGPKFWREPAQAKPKIIYVQAMPVIASSVDAGH